MSTNNCWRVKAIFYLAMLTQFTAILRAMGLFNPSTIIQIIKVLLSLTIWFGVFKRIKLVKLNTVEYLLLIIPLLSTILGVVKYGVTRDFFSDIFNALNFIVIIAYIKSLKYIKNRNFYYSMCKKMLLVLLVSLMIYEMMPMLGYKINTVGKTSAPFIFPLILFAGYSYKFNTALTFILLIVASKRGVIIAAIAALFMYYRTNKLISKKISHLMLTGIIVLSIFMVIYTSNHSNYADIQVKGLLPLLSKIERMNPLSERFNVKEDARVIEIKSAVKGLKNVGEYLVGGGPGYTYEFEYSELTVPDRHNTHFTPTSIMTKYGVIYMILLYYYILSTIAIAMKYRKINELIYFFGIYVFSSLIYSFTAFTLYTEYINIMTIALIRSYHIKFNNSQIE